MKSILKVNQINLLKMGKTISLPQPSQSFCLKQHQIFKALNWTQMNALQRPENVVRSAGFIITTWLNETNVHQLQIFGLINTSNPDCPASFSPTE